LVNNDNTNWSSVHQRVKDIFIMLNTHSSCLYSESGQ
jgi:hypothetical protein